MSHDYEVFHSAPVTPSVGVTDAAHDEQVRAQFARRLAIMLDEAGQDYAAALVRVERTDGGWP